MAAMTVLGQVKSRNPFIGFVINSEGQKVTHEQLSFGAKEMDGEPGVFIGGVWLSCRDWVHVSSVLNPLPLAFPG